MSFQIWIRTVERQYRIRLPEDAVAAIPWLDAKQTKIGVGFIGAFGQLQIAPEALETTVTQQLNTALMASPAEAGMCPLAGRISPVLLRLNGQSNSS